MKNDKVRIFDTTLRDGEQSAGIGLTTEDKLDLARQLERLGVDIIEAGFAASSSGDFQAIQTIAREVRNPIIASLARCVDSDIDTAWNAIKKANRPRIHVFISSSDLHIWHQLRSNPEKVLDMAASAVERAKTYCEDVEFSPMDATRTEQKYLYKILEVAINAGAKTVNIPDTVGYSIPTEFSKLVKGIIQNVPKINEVVVSVHCHNDLGLAVANSLAAILVGVRQVQGTINGLGERCGNANLMSLIPTFFLKEDFSSKFEINIKPNNIKNLTQCSRLLDEILNRKPNKHLPYVGAAAFSHKGGLHVSAVQKDPKTYEHIKPETVGNVRNIVVSDQAGKSNIISRLKSIGVDFKEDDPRIKKLLDEVKDREFIGYSYDGADASFELLARRIMGEIPRYISIKEYDVSVKKDNSGNIISSAKAQLEVDKKIILCEGEGNGPVHALDNAIRNNVDKLAKYSQYLKDLKLVDYKVRILNTGTAAVTRVSIESTDSKGKNWFTIGVSANIIEASFKALVDSLDYKLFKDNAPASN